MKLVLNLSDRRKQRQKHQKSKQQKKGAVHVTNLSVCHINSTDRCDRQPTEDGLFSFTQSNTCETLVIGLVPKMSETTLASFEHHPEALPPRGDKPYAGLAFFASIDPSQHSSPSSSHDGDLQLRTLPHDQTTTAATTTHEAKPSSQSLDAAEAGEGEKDGDDDGGDYPSGLRLLNLFLALILCMLLAVIDMTITATAVPHITDDFHSLNDIGWYASVFFMTVASSQSTWGKLYRYFDLKTTFLSSIALFELGNLICGMFVSYPQEPIFVTPLC